MSTRRAWLPAAVAFLALTTTGAHAGPVGAVWVPTLTVGVQGADHLNAMTDGTVYEFHTGGGVHGFWRSTNFGMTWLPLPDPPEAVFGTTGMVSANSGFAADYDTVYRSTDAAQSWQKVGALPLPKNRIASLQGLGAGKGSKTVVVFGQITPPLHVGCNFSTDTAFWTSHDNGATWRRFSIGQQHSVFNIRVYDDLRATALVYVSDRDVSGCGESSDEADVYVTTNGGKTWSVGLRCAPPNPCTAASFISRTTVLAGDVSGATFLSTNAGRSFRSGPVFRLPTTGTGADGSTWFWVQGVMFPSPLRGWLSVKGIGTYITSDGGRAWTLERSQDELYGVGVGDADASDRDHAVIAGPTFVSTRIPTAAPQVAVPARTVPRMAVSARSRDGATELTSDGRLILRLR